MVPPGPAIVLTVFVIVLYVGLGLGSGCSDRDDLEVYLIGTVLAIVFCIVNIIVWNIQH